MKRILLILPLVLTAFLATAQEEGGETPPLRPLPPSLFFTPDEAARLEAILWGKKDKVASHEVAPVAPEARPNVYLSALVYQGENDWSAWINGVKFRPGGAAKGIRVVKATERWVEMDVDTADGPTVRVRLKPNQTYLSAKDKIVDGVFP
jgi:hypothetical protein